VIVMMRMMRVPPRDRDIGIEATAWPARALAREPRIGIGARMGHVRVLPQDPDVRVEARMGLVRVLPQDPGSGRRIDGGKETGDGGCRESGGRRGEATIAGFARGRGEAPDPTNSIPSAEARAPRGNHLSSRVSHLG